MFKNWIAAFGDTRLWYALKYVKPQEQGIQCNSLTVDKNILVCDCEMNSILNRDK
jgi:hypothetical protein